MSEKKTYIEELEEKLKLTRARVRKGNQVKALKDAAPDLFDIIDTEISLEVNKMTQDTPLTHEQYLESHGAVRGIRRIRDLMNFAEKEAATASQEAKVVEEQLETLVEEKKSATK